MNRTTKKQFLQDLENAKFVYVLGYDTRVINEVDTVEKHKTHVTERIDMFLSGNVTDNFLARRVIKIRTRNFVLEGSYENTYVQFDFNGKNIKFYTYNGLHIMEVTKFETYMDGRKERKITYRVFKLEGNDDNAEVTNG